MPPTFRALFDHALDVRNVDVQLRAGAETAGLFVTEHCADGHAPHVEVVAPNRQDNLDEVEHTIVLAHELGHHESWLRCETTDDFEELIAHHATKIRERPGDYETAVRLEVIRDEVRAWRHGREILAVAVPTFSAWAAFDEMERVRLHGYLHGLLLDPRADAQDPLTSGISETVR